MPDSIDNSLTAAIRSMQSVIGPAIDSGHPLALEQADLVVKTLRMVQAQLPHRRAKARRELDMYLTMATDVLSVVDRSSAVTATLEERVSVAREQLSSTSVECIEIGYAAEILAACLSDVLRENVNAVDGAYETLAPVILASSAALVDDDVAWFASQGWAGAHTKEAEAGEQ